MPDKRNKNLKYSRIPLNEIRELRQLLIRRFEDFIQLKGFKKNTKINISHYSLIDIIIRVDKRKAYYQCFHNMEINECKEVALYAYWIIKLRPFTITDDRYITNKEACSINESFAIFLIGIVLEATKRIKRTSHLKDSYTQFIDYSFRFRNFSIDSFVVLVESIATGTFERDYPNLYDQ